MTDCDNRKRNAKWKWWVLNVSIVASSFLVGLTVTSHQLACSKRRSPIQPSRVSSSRNPAKEGAPLGNAIEIECLHCRQYWTRNVQEYIDAQRTCELQGHTTRDALHQSSVLTAQKPLVFETPDLHGCRERREAAIHSNVLPSNWTWHKTNEWPHHTAHGLLSTDTENCCFALLLGIWGVLHWNN